jgi:glycosyltransferase involved in cell wall biosynthesis
VNINYLSASDLENAYAHAFVFVYPSLSEGFGYPPLEAMRYGRPVLSSNCSSMPEILAEGAAYFSPFYENDFYAKYKEVTARHEEYAQLAAKRFARIGVIQKSDLDRMVNDYVFGA